MIPAGLALVLLGGVLIAVLRPDPLLWSWRDVAAAMPILFGLGLCFGSCLFDLISVAS